MSQFTPTYGVTTTLQSKVIKRTVTVKLSPLDIVRYAVKYHPNSLLKNQDNLQFKDVHFIEAEEDGLIFRGEVYTPEENTNE